MDMLALAFRNPLDARKAKKLRDILKLEDGAAMFPKESSNGATATTAAAEKVSTGEKLAQNQQDKIAQKDGLLKEVTALAGKLPGDSDVLGKTEDETQ
eukprot:s2562_g14.t1